MYAHSTEWARHVEELSVVEEAPDALGQLSCTRRSRLGTIPQTLLLRAYPLTYRVVTIEKIAVNAVMAGCLPEYMPVVITAMEAVLDERFLLHARPYFLTL